MKAVLFAILLVSTAAIASEPPVENWQIDGDLYVGAAVPFGTEKDTGVAMGGHAKVTYESTGRKVLIFGELTGEGFNNSDQSKDIQFSQFYLNTGLMLGAKAVKWKTPANVTISRDTILNEDFMVRYAFSGLYIKILDETVGENELHQILETSADFVIAHINYMTGWQNNRNCGYPGGPACPTEYPADGRTVLGLYAAIKYEIEKRGWGSSMQVEVLQDLSPSYTRLTGKLIGFKQLSGDLKNLRPYVELNGVLDHDATDPTGTLQGAVRVFGGISGRFGL